MIFLFYTISMEGTNLQHLMHISSKLLSTFNYKTDGVDKHFQSFLESSESNHLDENGRVFVSEVFAGCIRYNTLIKVIVDGYYASDGRTCLRSESSLYFVLSYLIMFRLEELGMNNFKKLMNSQHAGKMYKFLKFVFDENNLYGWIKDEWYKTYDSSFVDVNILLPVQRLQSEMTEYISHLDAIVNNRLPSSYTVKSTTEMKPFNLTKPKPRQVPTPEEIPTLKVYKPVPKTTYIPPMESETVIKNRETLKIRAKERLHQAEKMQFTCASTEKSQKTKTILKQIIDEREAELDHEPIKPLPFPTSMRESQPLKLNTAAILREGARIQKAEEEEEKRLAKLEAGQKDGSEFQKWQEEMKQKDTAKTLAEIKRKHLEGQLSYEEAIIARQNFIQDTRDKVYQMKEESEQLMMEYFCHRDDHKKEMRKLVETVMQGHQNAQEAKIKLQKMKQKIVQQVERESQELMARALEEAEEEMKRKVELIQQIRAMESVPIIRTKFVDLTETGGQGLLAEMSVAELRERLSLMKIAENEEKEKKRKEIVVTKEVKDQRLSDTLDAISRHRSEQNCKTNLRQDHQKKIFKQHMETHNKQLTDLQQRLETKKKERERIKQETSLVPCKSKNIKTNSQRVLKTPSSGQVSQSGSVLETLLRTTTISNS